MNRVVVPNRETDAVAVPGQLRANGLQPSTQIIAVRIAFKGENQVFRAAREGEEEAQASAALERERHHRPLPLQHAQDSRLKVLAGDVAALQRRRRPHEIDQMGFHSGS